MSVRLVTRSVYEYCWPTRTCSGASASSISRLVRRYPRFFVEQANRDKPAADRRLLSTPAVTNGAVETLREAVAIVAGRAKTEASGGVSLEGVRAIAETGVDFISVGAITHSARAVDIGLDFQIK